MFLEDVLRALASSSIPYCVVGGVAVNLHGVPRMTYDLDLVVAPEPAALDALAELLVGLGLRCRLPVQLRDFADRTYRDRMRDERNPVAVTFSDPTDPLREVDVLVSPPLDARGLVDRAVEVGLGAVAARVASLDDLIALKHAAHRAQDEDDARYLERIRSGDARG